MILLQLLWSFIQIGMFSVGGGYAAIPLIQSQVVEQHAWLTMSEFTNLITIAEMTPGPIAVNSATFVGLRVAGFGGAIVATLGCVFPSCIIVSLLAFFYYQHRGGTLLQSILASLRPAIVALIASAGLSILLQVVFQGAEIAFSTVNWPGLLLFAVAFLILRKYKWNPILIMSLCGVASLGIGLIPM